MGDKTSISWTATIDNEGNVHPGSTYNFWIGCTKISDGCKFCYAERENAYFKWTPGWGKGEPRTLTSEGNRAKVYKWAREAYKNNVLHRVFVSSLSDILDDEVSNDWRNDLWNTLDEAGELGKGNIEFLLLTKRIHLGEELLPDRWLKNPYDYPYIRIGVTAETQEWADKRIDTMLDIWGGKNFVSAEPLLGNISFRKWLYYPSVEFSQAALVEVFSPMIDWIIIGGESGPNARKMELHWASNIITQCKTAKVKVFVKQLGYVWAKENKSSSSSGADSTEWPFYLQTQEIP